jgi:hypothetical protein
VREAGAQRVHAVLRLERAAELGEPRERLGARVAERGRDARAARRVREGALEEEPVGVLERRASGEGLHVDPAEAEPPARAVDLRERRLRHHHAVEPAAKRLHRVPPSCLQKRSAVVYIYQC